MLSFIELYRVRNGHKVKRLDNLLGKISSDLLTAVWVADPELDTGYLIHYYDIDLTVEDLLYINKHLQPHGYVLSVSLSASNTLCISVL